MITQSLSQHPPLLHLPPVGLLVAPPLVLGLELLFTAEPALPHGLLQSSLSPEDVPYGQVDGDERSVPLLDGVKQGLLQPPRLVTSCWNSWNRSSPYTEPALSSGVLLLLHSGLDALPVVLSPNFWHPLKNRICYE